MPAPMPRPAFFAPFAAMRPRVPDPGADAPARAGWSFRLILACMVAVSVSLPMALISITKVILMVSALGYLTASCWRQRPEIAFRQLLTVPAVLVICLAFALSLQWTSADTQDALTTLVKHAKLIEILLLVGLLRTAREARIAITAFAIGQAIYILTAWLLVAGVPIPWADTHQGRYVVFSSYLDQSIIFATSAGVIWHLRSVGLWPRWLAGLAAVAALANVLLFQQGRTGYLVAGAMIALAILWDLPRKWRLLCLIAVPAAVMAALYLGSATFQGRVSKILPEGLAYAQQSDIETSSGWRLNAWHRSIQAIAQRPLAGHGVGSWTDTVKRLEGSSATRIFGKGNASNPHQEYLLWGVELGVPGILLLVAMMMCVFRDARGFDAPVARSAMSVLAAMVIACLFNSALYDGLIGDFFIVTLGLLLALGVRTRAAHATGARP